MIYGQVTGRMRDINMLAGFLRKVGFYLPGDLYAMRCELGCLLWLCINLKLWFLAAVIILLLNMVNSQIHEDEDAFTQAVNGLSQGGSNALTVMAL